MEKIKKISKYVLNILTIVATLISRIDAIEGIVIPYSTQIIEVIGVVNSIIATYLLGQKGYSITKENNETIEEPILEPIEEEKDEEPIIEQIEPPQEEIKEELIIEQVEVKDLANDLKSASNEEYVLLTNKERQTYLKELGLYTKSIDNTRGSGQKSAEKYFNIIFLNKNTSTYTEETDKLLREVYASYKKSKYMKDSDWKFFKNVAKKELYCTCKKKYCDGYNGLEEKIPMRLIMMAQYNRNASGQPIYISSSIRCSKRNKEIGGITKSKHMDFLALDYKLGKLKASETIKFKLPYVSYTYKINDYYVHSDIKI